MEWMGWNVLLEGRKLWTFLPPLPEIDASLATYRVSPNAFGSHDISAGWQSDVDLYRRRGRGRRCTSREGQVSPCWPSDSPAGQEVLQHATSGVQEEGDLVLIPPRHWHQVIDEIHKYSHGRMHACMYDKLSTMENGGRSEAAATVNSHESAGAAACAYSIVFWSYGSLT